MCTYSISVDDTLIEQLKPTLGADSDIHEWMQHQIELAVLRYVLQFNSKSVRKDSMQRITDISEIGGNAISLRDLEGILPAPQIPFDELRDEYISEKYGI